MRLLIRNSVSVLCVLLLLACSNRRQDPFEGKSQQQVREELQDMNRVLAKKEQVRIRRFIEQRDWPMEESHTGLHYWIYEPGEGDSIRSGDIVEVQMIVSLLNGDTCYHYERYGSERFKVERANVESGLQEVVQYMRPGGRAQVILPSHLAHGVAGDQNKIPPRSTVVYDLRVVSVTRSREEK